MDWKAVVAPAGTSPEVIKRLNAAIEKALTQPAMIASLAAEGSTPLAADPEQAAKYISVEQKAWGSQIREAGIKIAE